MTTAHTNYKHSYTNTCGERQTRIHTEHKWEFALGHAVLIIRATDNILEMCLTWCDYKIVTERQCQYNDTIQNWRVRSPQLGGSVAIPTFRPDRVSSVERVETNSHSPVLHQAPTDRAVYCSRLM